MEDQLCESCSNNPNAVNNTLKMRRIQVPLGVDVCEGCRAARFIQACLQGCDPIVLSKRLRLCVENPPQLLRELLTV